MNTTTVGRQAESAVEEKLLINKYEVLAKNWRTRFCEVDIIAKKQSVVHFIEVKFRQSPRHGDGLDYITPKKLKQMTFAAELWCHENDWRGDWRLSAVGVGLKDGNFVVGEPIEIN